MDWSPSIPSESGRLPEGCQFLGHGGGPERLDERLAPWRLPGTTLDLLLLLAATRTAEHPGISAAGATPDSRRFTALADAELLLKGPDGQRSWPLPLCRRGSAPRC